MEYFKVFDKNIYSYEMDYNSHYPPARMYRLINGGFFGALGRQGFRYPDVKAALNATHMVGMSDLHIYREVQMLNEVKSVEIYALPMQRTKALFMSRVYVVMDGEPIAMLNNASMIVGLSDHKVIPTKQAADGMGRVVPESAMPAPKRLQVPEDMELVREYEIFHYHCDLNKHMNSARYVDFICEALGYWEGKRKIMNRLRMEFNTECVPGDVLGIYAKKTETGWYVKGVKNGSVPAFKAYVEMKETEE